MQLCENFTKKELAYIINDSVTYKEVATRLGYNQYIMNKKMLSQIAQEYNVSIAHLKVTINDLRQKKFGKLTVKFLDKNRVGSSGQAYWICECDCGNYTSVRGTDLVAGKSASCGRCNAGKTKRMSIGDKYGKLTILDFLTENGKSLVKCQCECGNICVKPKNSVKTGHTQSCGCLVSKGEYKIENILKEFHIKYEQQKEYQDLIGKSRPLRFDFYLPEYNTCIEYQGEQHFVPMRFSHEQEKFEQRIKNDNKKREYCKENNITLIEIPYTDYNKIDINYLKEKLKEKDINFVKQ